MTSKALATQVEGGAMQVRADERPITLEEAIADLRKQISELPNDDPFFRIKGVELELAVTTERSATEKLGLNWVVSAGGEATSKDGTHHKIRIQLELVGPGLVNQSGG